MIYENLSGSGTGFTIANAPINSDLFFLVFLGHFCTRVASSPGVGEYTLSGTTLTLGFTKDTGDELYCWSETLATRALLVGTVSGAKNGSNKNFTLSESIPSGTEPILVHNGMPLNPTGTGTNHYARTGGGFTLDAAHPAPDVGDQLDIYVAVTGAASGLFHILTLSQPATLNPAYVDGGLLESFGLTQYVLAHFNGRMYGPVFGIYPEYGQVRHYPVDGYVQFPTMVSLSTDKVKAWEIGTIASTTAAFDKWLSMNLPRVLYAEIDLVKVGATKTIYVASEMVQAYDTVLLSWQDWLPFLVGGVHTSKALPDTFTGETVSSYGSLTLSNSYDPKSEAWELDADFGLTSGYSTFGQDVSLWWGGEPTDLLFNSKQLLFSGQMESATREWGRITIPLQDAALQLKKKTIHEVIDIATTYPEAPEEVDGKTIPIHLGKVLNFTPVLVNVGKLVYSVGVVSEITAVYDNGYPVVYKVGSYALIESGDEIMGDGDDVVAFFLAAQPVGTVTCDTVGKGLYGTRPALTLLPDILFDLAQAAGLSLSIGSSQLFAQAYNYEVGLVVDEPTSYESLMQTLLGGTLGAYDILPDQSYQLILAESPAGKGSVLKVDGWDEAVGTGWALTERGPIYKTTLTYGNNETVMTSGISAAVSLARQEFLKAAERTVESKDTGVLITYPEASDEGVIATRFINKADALAAAARRIALLKTPRQVLKLRLPLSAYAVRMGDVIKLDFSERYGMGNTQWLVIRKEFDLLSGQSPSTVTFELMK